MIVYRVTFKAKLGCIGKIVQIFKEMRSKQSGIIIKCRAYTPYISQGDVVVLEWEYENLAAFENTQKEMGSQPDAAVFMKDLHELIETGGFIEILKLTEI